MRGPWLRAELLAGALILATAVGFSAVGTTPAAMAAGCPGRQTSWMKVKQSSNAQGVLNSDNWGGGTVCVTNRGGTANFTVAQSAGSYTGSVLAYPDINVGCRGGYCSTSKELPAAESSITPEVTWSTEGPQNGSKFDTGIDSWFARSGSEGSKPTPTGEVMVVINSSNFAGLGLPQSGTPVSIDGYQWYVKYSPAGSRGWPYTQYALAQSHVLDRVSGLDMAKFYANAISKNNLPAGQYLTDIGAGNEIWAGGVGLATTNLLISGL